MKKLSALLLILFSAFSMSGFAQEKTYEDELDHACECIGSSMDEFLPMLNAWFDYMDNNPGLTAEQGMEGYLGSLNEDELKDAISQVEEMGRFFNSTESNVIDECMQQEGQTDLLDDMIETEIGRKKILKHLQTLDCKALTAVMRIAIMGQDS